MCERMQQILAMLGSGVHRGKDTTLETMGDHVQGHVYCARPWPQQCWKNGANGSNIVALRFGDHRTKEMLGVVGSTV